MSALLEVFNRLWFVLYQLRGSHAARHTQNANPEAADPLSEESRGSQT